jgi:hypothetical protein
LELETIEEIIALLPLLPNVRERLGDAPSRQELAQIERKSAGRLVYGSEDPNGDSLGSITTRLPRAQVTPLSL